MRLARQVPFLLAVVALSSGTGLLYTSLTNGRSYVAGMIYGACIGFVISSVERGAFLTGAQMRVRQWPTLGYILVTEAAAIVLVSIGFGVA